jgi:hypothetical protein
MDMGCADNGDAPASRQPLPINLKPTTESEHDFLGMVPTTCWTSRGG